MCCCSCTRKNSEIQHIEWHDYDMIAWLSNTHPDAPIFRCLQFAFQTASSSGFINKPEHFTKFQWHVGHVHHNFLFDVWTPQRHPFWHPSKALALRRWHTARARLASSRRASSGSECPRNCHPTGPDPRETSPKHERNTLKTEKKTTMEYGFVIYCGLFKCIFVV